MVPYRKTKSSGTGIPDPPVPRGDVQGSVRLDTYLAAGRTIQESHSCDSIFPYLAISGRIPSWLIYTNFSRKEKTRKNGGRIPGVALR
ncbi:hypothetical protein CEXT_267041 [Caerostris extrusa]|uniref:Uncharacterized protein n=1 Tax=Caerostris extrusa TaxID=172846 RepID=A0AAV4V870_CAEEX|nr:hypothetical protein CEXT_267041 [Caerostris extrusa]